MKTKVEKQIRLLYIWASLLTLLILLLFFLLGRSNSNNERQQALSNNEIVRLDSIVSELREDLKVLTKNVIYNNQKLDSIENICSNLETRIESNQWTIIGLRTNMLSMKIEIYDLKARVDSLESGLTKKVEIFNTRDLLSEEDYADTLISEKNLSIKITKRNFDRHSKLLKSDVLLDYNSDINLFSESGFSQDTLTYIYKYLDENNNVVILNFYNGIKNNIANFRVHENKENSEETEILMSDIKSFMTGAGGLLTKEDLFLNWEHQFWENSPPSKKQKQRGVVKILSGSLLTAGGIYGIHHYYTHPVSVTKIYRNGELVEEAPFFSDTGKATSILGTALGIALTSWGVSDMFRWSLTLNTITLTANLSEITNSNR